MRVRVRRPRSGRGRARRGGQAPRRGGPLHAALARRGAAARLPRRAGRSDRDPRATTDRHRKRRSNDQASNAGSHRAALTECVRACGGSRRRHDQVRVTVGRGQPDLQQEQPVQTHPAGGQRRLGRRHGLACQGQLRRAGVDREGSDPDRGRLRSEHDLRAYHRARAGQPRVPEHRRDQQRRERSDEPVGCCRPRPWNLQQHRQGDLRHRRGVARDHAGGGQRHPRQPGERMQQRLRRRCRNSASQRYDRS